MNFKLVICPKCGKKHIFDYIVTGSRCFGCDVYLNKDDEDNRKEIRKEQVKSADAFSRNFGEFQEHLKREEKRWNIMNVFVRFKTVTIDDEKLLEMVK